MKQTSQARINTTRHYGVQSRQHSGSSSISTAKDVLVLCCCSNSKEAGTTEDYKRENSTRWLLDDPHGEELIQARAHVHQLISDGIRSADGTALKDLPHNFFLRKGRDFGGQAGGSRYMPAQFRYRGRFYKEVDPREEGVLGNDTHHWLIVSALYGLVAPKESIQQYSCHRKDNSEITAIWSNGLLTALLLHFIRKHEVAVVVDLIADESYRDLINWNQLRNQLKVLRAYGDQNSGPPLLRALGQFARDTLSHMQASELLSIDTHRSFPTDYEVVALAPGDPPFPIPPSR